MRAIIVYIILVLGSAYLITNLPYDDNIKAMLAVASGSISALIAIMINDY